MVKSFKEIREHELEFWSMERRNGHQRVALRKGFTDGNYNFYQNENGTWYAVDPENGYAVGSGDNFGTAIADAYSDERQKIIQREIDAGRYAKYAEDFQRCCEEQGVSPDDWTDRVSTLSDLFI